ncbi:MAG TPA: hypothetical protein VF404_00765 [Sphingomonas sp.]
MGEQRIAISIAITVILLCVPQASASPSTLGGPPSAIKQNFAERPLIITYDATNTLSAMQEARGTLAVKNGCVVLREAKGTWLLIWRRPAKVKGTRGEYHVEQMGRIARIGQPVVLTGTGGGKWVSDAYARQKGVPVACRAFRTFSVNGILSPEAD